MMLAHQRAIGSLRVAVKRRMPEDIFDPRS